MNKLNDDILVLTKYERNGASSRVRFFQFFPELTRAGLKIQYQALFDESYITLLQSGRRSVINIIFAYLRRLFFLLAESSKQYQMVWIEKELFPWIPAVLENLVLRRFRFIFFDYDDAVFHLYDMHKISIVRRVLAGKYISLNACASMTFCGNEYIRDYFLRSGVEKTKLIPTVVDYDRYGRINKKGINSDRVIVGWIGQKSTQNYLNMIEPVLRELVLNGVIEFVVIGGKGLGFSFPVTYFDWTEDSEIESIHRLQVGLMPLPDNSFENGKCGYKLIQYLAAGVAVVASPVGVNRVIVDHGINGFLADDIHEWKKYLYVLISSPEFRVSCGARGKEKIKSTYSVSVVSQDLIREMSECAK